MSQEASVTDGVPSALREDYRWIRCKGCKGEVGIPSDWSQDTVDCPQCGMAVQVRGGVLYRPPIQADPPPVQQPVTAVAHPTPSLKLSGRAISSMVWGLLSVGLGWTVIVPFIGLCCYLFASETAKEERVLVPWQGTLGLALSLLFGAAQGLVVIIHFLR
jgi:hypothetical protein